MDIEEKEEGEGYEKIEKEKLKIGRGFEEYQVKVRLVLMGQIDSTWSIVKKFSEVDYGNHYRPNTVDFGYNEYNIDT